MSGYSSESLESYLRCLFHLNIHTGKNNSAWKGRMKLGCFDKNSSENHFYFLALRASIAAILCFWLRCAYFPDGSWPASDSRWSLKGPSQRLHCLGVPAWLSPALLRARLTAKASSHNWNNAACLPCVQMNFCTLIGVASLRNMLENCMLSSA